MNITIETLSHVAIIKQISYSKLLIAIHQHLSIIDSYYVISLYICDVFQCFLFAFISTATLVHLYKTMLVGKLRSLITRTNVLWSKNWWILLHMCGQTWCAHSPHGSTFPRQMAVILNIKHHLKPWNASIDVRLLEENCWKISPRCNLKQWGFRLV